MNGAALAKAAMNSREAGNFKVFTSKEAAVVEAFSARIIPTTDTPGAREAGAVWFIDAVLANGFADALPVIRDGISALDQSASGDFAAAAPDTQDALITAIEDGPAFELLHFLTLAGTFTMASYGGNRGEVGWDLLGFERGHHWQAPFGYYDGQLASTNEEASS
jgi:hypothetical protein